jgi:hypothetical protein
MLARKKIPYMLNTAASSNIYRVRNNLVFDALSNGATRIVWIDNDILWTPEQFERLISYEEEVVTGWYCDSDGEPTIGKWESMARYEKTDINTWCGLTKIAWAPGGFISVSPSVYRSIGEYPWYRYAEINGQPIGEDIQFCNECKRIGISIYCDPLLRVQHYKGYWV